MAKLERKALVISRNGDIVIELRELLLAQGFQPISAGTGHEGVEAMAHYQPKVVILYFRKGEQDTIVLRAIQDFCLNSGNMAAIISPDVQAVECLLGKTCKSNHCKVFTEATYLFEEQRPRVAVEVQAN